MVFGCLYRFSSKTSKETHDFSYGEIGVIEVIGKGRKEIIHINSVIIINQVLY